MLLEKLNDISFYKLSHPKSLGREWVEENIYPKLQEDSLDIKDQICTFCEHAAMQIGKYLNDEEVLITGGGAMNKYLIERIQHYSSSNIIILAASPIA